MKDLIDREKALDCFHDWVDKYGDVHTADEMTEYQAIEALPTEKSQCALCQYNDLEWDEEPCESCTMGGENNHFKPKEQPDRKKGEWIPEFDGKFTGGAYWFSCSKCKRIVPEVRNGGWNFCPNCGADMRGEAE